MMIVVELVVKEKIEKRYLQGFMPLLNSHCHCGEPPGARAIFHRSIVSACNCVYFSTFEITRAPHVYLFRFIFLVVAG